MRKIYSSYDSLMIGYLCQILDDHGIRSVVKNEYLMGGAGEIPQTECWPELWVIEDGDCVRALKLVQAALKAPAQIGEDWSCPSCGESIEGQFTDCWNCGSARP